MTVSLYIFCDHVDQFRHISVCIARNCPTCDKYNDKIMEIQYEAKKERDRSDDPVYK